MLDESGLDLITASDMADGAEKAVEAAKVYHAAKKGGLS